MIFRIDLCQPVSACLAPAYSVRVQLAAFSNSDPCGMAAACLAQRREETTPVTDEIQLESTEVLRNT